MPFQRRTFFAISASAAASTWAYANALATAEPASLPIIDTHQHLWDLVQFQPPWLKGAEPQVAAKHDMQDYLSATAGLNVVKAIYMEIDVAPADQLKEANYVLDIIRSQATPTVAAVISGRPGEPAFAKYMERFRDQASIKGVRQVLHAGSAERGLCLTDQFIESIQLLGKMDKSYDLCMRPDELGDGAQLAQKCPETRFIVDHCGNADPHAWWPKQRQKSQPSHTVDVWKRDMNQLAKLPNVVCKISGIVARMPEGWQTEDLAPAINFCLDEFGPDRVMFGGDWPVCKIGASYAQWVTALKEIVSPRPATDQKKLFHDNAQAFYHLA